MDERVEVANDVSGRRTNFDLTRKRTNSSNGNRKKGATEDGTHSDVEKDLENDSHSEMDVNEGRRTPSGRKTAPASSMATKSSGRSRSPSLVFEPTCTCFVLVAVSRSGVLGWIFCVALYGTIFSSMFYYPIINHDFDE